MKIKNVGTTDYTGSRVSCGIGETVEVDADLGAYLLSATDSPGKFEVVDDPKPSKSAKATP